MLIRNAQQYNLTPATPQWPQVFATSVDYVGWGSSTMDGAGGATVAPFTYMQSTLTTGGTLYNFGTPPPASGGVIIDNEGQGGKTSSQVLTQIGTSTARQKAAACLFQFGGNWTAVAAGTSPTDQAMADLAACITAVGHTIWSAPHKHNDGVAIFGNRDHTRLERLMREVHIAYPGRSDSVSLMFNKIPGLSGTDLTAQTNDQIPPSLQVDTAHANSLGNQYIAKNCYTPFLWALSTGKLFVPHQKHYFNAPTALNTNGVVVGTVPYHPSTTITGATFDFASGAMPDFSVANEAGAIVLRRATANVLTNGYYDIPLRYIHGGVQRTVWQRVHIIDSSGNDTKRVANHNQFMVREKTIAGVPASSKKFTFFMLFRPVSGDGVTRQIAMLGASAGLRISLLSSNRMSLQIRDTANLTNPVNLDANAGTSLVTVANGWRAMFFSCDTTTGVQIARWALDQLAANTNVPTADALLAIAPDSATGQHRLFATTDTGASPCDCEVGAIWMAADYIDFSVLSNRNLFYNSATMLSTIPNTGIVGGITPFLWMQGPPGNWASGLNLMDKIDGYWNTQPAVQWTQAA